MSDTVLEMKARARRFGALTAVDSLTFSLNAGEVFGSIVIGEDSGIPNGLNTP
jgi:ABC-type branched-subunit amino acid transport system ATPase component